MKRLKYGVYWLIRSLVRLFYRRPVFEGLENLPQGGCIVASNHCHTHGPIVSEIYFPGKKAIWCAGEMMDITQVPEYTYRDFWWEKPRHTKWFYKALSYFIAPFSVCLFPNAPTIPVYRDQRVIRTFRLTLDALKEDKRVIIFPEEVRDYNHILCDFQRGFVDAARSYYNQTGKRLPFVPMYLCPSLHKAIIGTPILFDPDAPIRQERERICQYLMEQITLLAQAQPRHLVIPYRNIPRKHYSYNHPQEEPRYEKTPC